MGKFPVISENARLCPASHQENKKYPLMRGERLFRRTYRGDKHSVTTKRIFPERGGGGQRLFHGQEPNHC